MVIGILGLCAIGLIIISGARLCARYLRRIVCALQHDVQADVSGICPVRYLHELHHHAVPALEKKERILQVFGGIGLVLLLWTFGYFWNERVLLVRKCFRSVRVPRTRCDSAFWKMSFPRTPGAIRWLDETIEGQPVVLEANGDSYSDYERVSAMTGLPTVLGWYVHEWLWRGDPQT